MRVKTYLMSGWRLNLQGTMSYEDKSTGGEYESGRLPRVRLITPNHRIPTGD